MVGFTVRDERRGSLVSAVTGNLPSGHDPTRRATTGSSFTRWRSRLRALTATALFAGAALVAYQHRGEISAGAGMLSDLRLCWLGAAVVAEAASMLVFARLQHWLLAAGGVRLGMSPMLAITLAGNAMATSLPGGAAWSATWAFGQLRRRGANRTLAGWVVLVSGGLASFAVFLIVAVGAFIAGNRGPVSQLRWLAGLLTTIPILIFLGYRAVYRNSAVHELEVAVWEAVSARLAPLRAVGRLARRLADDLALVRPGVRGWLEAFGLAMANWAFDAVVLVVSMEALKVPVPWRGVLVVYGFTQVSASLPITPGGLGVVEGSMTALLIAYGTPASEAFAVVLLYRLVSFWGLVPVGWGTWFALEFADRLGIRHQAHPWAVHDHGPEPAPVLKSLGPERILRPETCRGCHGMPAALSLSPSRGARSGTGPPPSSGRLLPAAVGCAPGCQQEGIWDAV